MATYTTGAGKTYATIADAITAVVAAVGATPSTEEHQIDLYGAATFSETVTLPTYANCSVTREFPMVIQTAAGEGQSTINGNIIMDNFTVGSVRFEDVITSGRVTLKNNTRGLIFKDCSMTITASTSAEQGGPLRFEGCDIDVTGNSMVYFAAAGSRVLVEMENCEVRVADNMFGSGADNAGFRLHAWNCRLLGGGTKVARVFDGSLINDMCIYFDVRQSAFYNFDDLINAVGDSPIEKFIFKNNIVESANSLITTTRRLGSWQIDATGNRYQTMTALYDSGGTDYADVAAAQAAGWETDSDEGDPSFTSTVWGNADFLRPSSATTLVPNAGIGVDAEGTLTTAALVEQGALTSVARTPVTVTQAAAATGLTVTDNADGDTWLVTATGAGAGVSVYIYNHSGDALITILDGTADTGDLTAGQTVYCKLLEDSKTLSTRFPVASGVTVPSLTSPATPTAPTQNATVAGDTQMTIDLIADDAGDALYVIWREAGDGKAWTAINESFKRTGSGTIVVTGLTNGTDYRFVGINKSGSLLSVPSNTRWGTPTTAASAMTPEEAVRKLLTDDTEVSAMISSRVYAQLAPQKAATPYIVYSRVSGNHLQHTTAASGLAETRIQLDIYGATYAGAKDLAEEVRLALDGYSGVVSTATETITIKTITIEGHIDGFESPPSARQKGIHRVIMDYTVWYAETVPTF